MAKKSKKIKKVKKIKPESAKTGSEAVQKTRIRVIGIGGGGGSIIAEIAPQIKKVDFVVSNTDIQALKEVRNKARIFQFGQNLTRGLGCGMDPKIGKSSAKDSEQKIAGLFKNVDFAILVSCLGGGTGSGASPEFARIAKEMGVMTFGIFTLPFKFEGAKRTQIARLSLEKLIPNLNAFAVVPNENIFKIIGKDTPIVQAFSLVNKRFSDNLRGLVEMIYSPGVVNIDFADLKTILSGKGKLTYLNSVIVEGQNRAEEAIKELLESPLNEYAIDGAEKILFNITASKDLGMMEVELISRTISDFNRRAKIIFGVSQDNNYGDKIRVTLLAVGCGNNREKCSEEPKHLEEPEKTENSAKKKKPAKSKPKNKKPKNPQAKRKTPPLKKKSQPKKVKVKKVVEVKKAESAPVLIEEKRPARKNGLDLKKEIEESGEEFFEEEKKWETPAFLRRQEG